MGGGEEVGGEMINPSSILKEYLAAELLADSDSSPIFIASTPETPDDCVTVYDTSGTLDGRIMRTGEVIDKLGIQIRIRSKDYQAGWQQIQSIALALDALTREEVSLNSGEVFMIVSMSRTSPILPLGLELESKKRRWLFTVNYLMTIKQVS